LFTIVTEHPVTVTVWSENIHERVNNRVAAVYPDGMHNAIAEGLRERLGADVQVRTATLDQDEHGLPDAVLDTTDVLTWWGHVGHDKVPDELVDRIQARVLDGMGLIVLHSGHLSKIFRRLMGTACSLKWREADDKEVVWTIDPAHPITAGLPPAFVIPAHEMYGERFDIPQPDDLVFVSWFSGGEVFRSGCCFHRGKGRIFYFSPGHETYPIYFQPEIRTVIANAVRWANNPTPAAIDGLTSHAPTGWFEDESIQLGQVANNLLEADA
jgi:trehalose utilization protein